MQHKEIIITSLLGFISTFEASMILIAVPTISDYFNISHLQASLLITIYVAIEALLFVPFSIVFERFGLRSGMILGGTFLAIGGFLIFLSNSFFEMELFRIIQAIGASIVLPSSLAYASRLGGDSERGSAIGINHGIVSLGYVFGLPVGGISTIFDWKILFLVSSLVALVGLFLVLRISNIHGRSSIGHSAFGPGLALSGVVIVLFNVWAGIAIITVGLIMSMKSRLPGEYIKSSISGFMHSITRNGFAAFLVFLYASLGYNALQYSLLVLLFPLSFTVFSLTGGRAFDRLGKRQVPMLAFFLMSLFSLSIFVNYILAEVLLGIASGLATTSNTSYTMGSLEKGNRTVGSALRTLQGAASMSIGLSLASIISIKPGQIALTIMMLNAVACIVVLFYNPRRLKKE